MKLRRSSTATAPICRFRFQEFFCFSVLTSCRFCFQEFCSFAVLQWKFACSSSFMPNSLSPPQSNYCFSSGNYGWSRAIQMQLLYTRGHIARACMKNGVNAVRIKVESTKEPLLEPNNSSCSPQSRKRQFRQKKKIMISNKYYIYCSCQSDFAYTHTLRDYANPYKWRPQLCKSENG